MGGFVEEEEDTVDFGGIDMMIFRSHNGFGSPEETIMEPMMGKV